MGTPSHVAPNALFGKSSNPSVAAVTAQHDGGGTGVLGQSDKGSGIVATSSSGQGLTVFSDNDVGIFAQGATWAGVFNGRLVVNASPKGKDPFENPPRDGSIVVNAGDLFLNAGHIFANSGTVHCFDCAIENADCAEDFDVCGPEGVEPGTVMSFNCEGTLRPSDQAYDRKVAGVISGAGEFRPGIVLDRRKESFGTRVPLALVGKVYCKVDATDAPVEVGDLLTTSSTPGHAMKAEDHFRAFGAVIGKALRPLTGGRGLVPILIALQ
jgi:hypothetical protein